MIESPFAAAAPPSADHGLTFLEARRVLERFTGGDPFPFLLGMAGTSEPLRVYLEAACAREGRSAEATFLPFGTLGQFLNSGEEPQRPEALLLFPWDLAPELDWRSGVPADRVNSVEIIASAERTAAQLTRRNAALLYVAAPAPPVCGVASDDAALRLRLAAIAAECGAVMLPAEVFTLSGYFTTGCPVAGAWLGRVATSAVSALLSKQPAVAKLLVTDLDNTLWGGVVAEVGVDGLAHGPSGAGFRHHVFQSLLARLRREGALLAAVSRNDQEVVDQALASDAMVVGASDFVAVRASYHAKSAQVRDLAERLNIGLDTVVFVDDNPVELEEVRSALPQVRVTAFPARDAGLPAFLDDLASAFGRRDVTPEDRERTDLYRRRAEGAVPASVSGADLTRFLESLEMRLDIRDRSRGDRARALQLINKTNQFNANGRRWTDDGITAVLAGGGRLLAASLSDRTGSHGEVVACLIDATGVIEAFVMSCRVFQRRVEHAFLATLVARGPAPVTVRHASTERNEPFRQFVADPAFSSSREDLLAFDAPQWMQRHGDAVDLFDIRWE